MGRLRQRNGTWYADYEDAQGHRRRLSLKTRDRKVAKERLRQLELATTNPAAHGNEKIGDAFDYLFDVAMPTAGRSPATISCYQQKARHVERLLGQDMLLRELTKDIVRQYIAKRLEENAARGSIHKELVALRQALTEAKERGMYGGDIREVVPRFEVRYRPKTRWLTVPECQAVIQELNPQRRLWFALACFGGLRASEVEGLRWEHVDLERRRMRVRGTKTSSSDRIVVITPMLLPWLELDAHGLGPVVMRWENYRRDLERTCRRAGVDKVSANDLRRTFASWMLQAGVDLLTVSRMLGHRSMRMVELVYGQLSEDSYHRAAERCAVFVTDSCAQAAKKATPETQAPSPENEKTPESSGVSVVPRDGIGPPTRGFSGLVPDELSVARAKRNRRSAR